MFEVRVNNINLPGKDYPEYYHTVPVKFSQ